MPTSASWLRGLAVLHLAVGLLAYREPLLAWVQAGVLNGVEPHWDRVAAFWFMLSGWLLLMLGGLAAGFERQARPLPPTFLWNWLALGLLGTLAMPLSGFPLVTLAAGLALRGQRADLQRREMNV